MVTRVLSKQPSVNMKYLDYKERDFLRDPDFVEWRLCRTAEQDEHWKQIADENSSLGRTIENAARLFDAGVALNDYKDSDHHIEASYRMLRTRISGAGRRRRALKRTVAVVAGVAACAAVALVALRHDGGWMQDTADVIVQAGTVMPEEFGEITIVRGAARMTFGNDAEISVADLMAAHANTVAAGDVAVEINRLIVPGGRRSSLLLPDGSRLWANAGSEVAFPSEFAADRREIFVDGEIYIEVAADAARPFYVTTESLSVRVLGTKFGIADYRGDDARSVVLVSGSVEVEMPALRQKMRLIPNECLTYEGAGFDVRTVDCSEYVSWRNGWLQNNRTPFRALVARLAKYYNVQLCFEEALGDVECTGKFMLHNDFEVVVQSLCISLGIRFDKDEMTFYR